MSSNAQKPSGLEGMKYQAVVRDAAGGILKNQSVSFRFSIIEGASVPVYIETHLLTTNEFGLVNLQIGRGAVSQGIFVDISWTVGSYFIEVEMDAAGGSNYKVLSTSEILSVPYAQFAGNVIYTDTSASNEIQTISLNNDTLYLSNGGFVDLKSYNTSVDLNSINARLDADSISLDDHESKLELRRLADSAIVNKMVLDSINMQREINKNKTDISNHLANDLDIDSTNEIQSLSGTSSGNIQNIVLDKSGGSVSFSTNDADSDTTNEIQDLKLTGNILTITKNGTSKQIDLSKYLDNTDAQKLTLANDSLRLDSSKSVSLGQYKQTLQLADSGLYRNVTISNGNRVRINIADGDTSSSNEHQDLSSTISNDSALISISNGKSTKFSIRDVDSDTSNEIQSLRMSNDTLFLSDGGYVRLPLGGGNKGLSNILDPFGYTGIAIIIGAGDTFKIPRGKALRITDDIPVDLLMNGNVKHTIRSFNAIISSQYSVKSNPYFYRNSISGYLVDSSSQIEPIVIDTNKYKVKTGFTLFLTSYGAPFTASNGKHYFDYKIDNKNFRTTDYSILIVPSNKVLDGLTGHYSLNGYLVKDDSYLFEPEYISGNQVLSVSHDSSNIKKIAITDGNEIEINVADGDSSALNEIQSLRVSGDSIFISKSNYILVNGLSEIDEFRTYSTFTDSRDGQTYKTVRFNNQIWMAENLNFNATGNQDLYFNNDSSTYAERFGRLYSWSSFMAGDTATNNAPSGVQGVCPVGWHIPSDKEWEILELTLGANVSSFALSTRPIEDQELGYKLSSTSSDDWTDVSNNYDIYKFSAQGSGAAQNNIFYYLKTRGMYATTTTKSAGFITRRFMNGKINIETSPQSGTNALFVSIRCVKD